MARTVSATPQTQHRSGARSYGSWHGSGRCAWVDSSCGIPQFHLAVACPARDADPIAPAYTDDCQTWHALTTLRYSAAALARTDGRPQPAQLTHTFVCYSYVSFYHASEVGSYRRIHERRARAASRRDLGAARRLANTLLHDAADDCDCLGRCVCVFDELPEVEPFRPRGSARADAC